jgi:glutaredoxin
MYGISVAQCTTAAQPRRRLSLPVALAALGLAIVASSALAASPNLDEFAQCLAKKGATMYGASWCPYCKAQLKAFGSAAQHLQYVECAEQGSEIQTADCTGANITSYPTWEFGDGSRLTGNVTLERLGKKTGCHLPAQGATKPSHGASADGEAPHDETRLPPRRFDPHL